MKYSVHTIYKNSAGVRVCAVTTFLGVLAKPPVIHWAWEQGILGLDYRKVRDAASDTGTLTHYLIMNELAERDVRQELIDEYGKEAVDSTNIPMKKWHDWQKQHKLVPILVETPMVSEKYQVGGCPDFYGLVDGIPTLLDFKTGKNVYLEAFYQTAAYKEMIEEKGGLICLDGEWETRDWNYPIDSVKILRFGKTEDEGFEEREVTNLDKHFKLFRCCQQIYNLQRELKGDTF